MAIRALIHTFRFFTSFVLVLGLSQPLRGASAANSVPAKASQSSTSKGVAEPAAPARSSSSSLQCRLLPDLFKIYLMHHYEHRTMSEELQSRTAVQMLATLDPSKTMLLESDSEKIRASLVSMFAKLEGGDCRALLDANQVLLARAKENEQIAKKILGAGYKLDESVEFQSNPKKRGYSKTLAERDELTRKLIHFQVQNYLLTDVTLAEAKKSTHHRYELIVKRVEEKSLDDLMDNFLESFAASLDPHSSYLSRDNLEDFQIQMSLSLEGIGATLGSQDGYTVVEDIIPGGAADRAKVLQPQDKIIAVAQDGQKPVNVIDMELQNVVKLIRGKKGTKVSLTVLRAREKTERLEVAIVRDKIDIKDQAAKLGYETRKVGSRELKIGVIELPSFYGEGRSGARSSYRDVRALVQQAKREKSDAIVLNLSRNGGGLLEDAVRMSGLFLARGGVVATQNTQRAVEVLEDEDSGIEWSGPLVVLTSRLSASASEILAGALQDYGRAVIVGDDHTFGKGTVQAVTSLPRDLGAMKVTTGMFFLPKGNSTQHQGVPSDVPFPSTWPDDEVGEKNLDYSLGPRKIDSFVAEKESNSSSAEFRWKPVNSSVVTRLRDASKVRIGKEPKFAEIVKDAEEAARNKGVIRLSDIRKKSEKDEKKDGKKDKDKTRKQAREDKLKDAEAPFLTEAVNVAADLSTILSETAVGKR